MPTPSETIVFAPQNILRYDCNTHCCEERKRPSHVCSQSDILLGRAEPSALSTICNWVEEAPDLGDFNDCINVRRTVDISKGAVQLGVGTASVI